jgi:hypothetical protein
MARLGKKHKFEVRSQLRALARSIPSYGSEKLRIVVDFRLHLYLLPDSFTQVLECRLPEWWLSWAVLSLHCKRYLLLLYRCVTG